MNFKFARAALLAVALAVPAWLAFAQHTHDPARHEHATAPKGHTPAADHRVEVRFPADLRAHTLANMRDHLLALQEIQASLARGRFDQAADVAEQRLGMSSLATHGAHDVAQYMPQGMQDAGSAMHRSASRFARAALDASATSDTRPALAALAEVTGHCVACHAGYRLQ